MPFKRMKAFFSKNSLSSSKILIFTNLKTIWLFFVKKNFTIKVENIFLRNISFDRAFYNKFATFTDFEKFKFFLKKTNFLKEPNFFTYLKNFTICRILRQICSNLVMKNFQNPNRPDIWNSDIFHWQVNVKNAHVDWMILLPYYKLRLFNHYCICI